MELEYLKNCYETAFHYLKAYDRELSLGFSIGFTIPLIARFFIKIPGFRIITYISVFVNILSITLCVLEAERRVKVSNDILAAIAVSLFTLSAILIANGNSPKVKNSIEIKVLDQEKN